MVPGSAPAVQLATRANIHPTHGTRDNYEYVPSASWRKDKYPHQGSISNSSKPYQRRPSKYARATASPALTKLARACSGESASAKSIGRRIIGSTKSMP